MTVNPRGSPLDRARSGHGLPDLRTPGRGVNLKLGTRRNRCSQQGVLVVGTDCGREFFVRAEAAVSDPPADDRLEVLYLRHGPEALKLAYLLTGDRELSEDIAQEAFVRVARRLTGLRNADSFRWYLRRTVVNLANSHLRRRRVERAH